MPKRLLEFRPSFGSLLSYIKKNVNRIKYTGLENKPRSEIMVKSGNAGSIGLLAGRYPFPGRPRDAI